MDALVIGEAVVSPGERISIEVPVGNITSSSPVKLAIEVVHGKSEGPCLLVTGCLHGDELNGAEIVRRLLRSASLKRLRGTLLAVPVLNLPAFLMRTRYMPDRRDLNRCFPGAASGSLGARLANVITSQLLPLCDAVIDLHTGAVNRPNLPQIRISPENPEAMKLAKAFGAPVIMISQVRDGSFRGACQAASKPVILFESGEAARLEAATIRFGMRGISSVMRQLGMFPPRKEKEAVKPPPVICRKSSWERSPSFGLFTPLVSLGKAVSEGDLLGFVADPLSGEESSVEGTGEGIVVGRTNEGLVDEGDALFHIAVATDAVEAEGQIAESGDTLPDIDEGNDDHPVHHDPFSEV